MSLLSHAPEVEYSAEVDDILEAYLKIGPQVQGMTDAIQNVSDRWFGLGGVPLARSKFMATRLCEVLLTVDTDESP